MKKKKRIRKPGRDYYFKRKKKRTGQKKIGKY